MIYHRKNMIEATETGYLLHCWHENKQGEAPPYGLVGVATYSFKTLRAAVNSPYSSIAEEQAVTDYIVFSMHPDYVEFELITASKTLAQKKLNKWEKAGVPELHLHKVVGVTGFPLNEDNPVSEDCLSKSC